MARLIALMALALVLVTGLPCSAAAHGGRTDGQGGHRDNRNASGLGAYHYHHGMGAHLHQGDVCPYSTQPSSIRDESGNEPAPSLPSPNGGGAVPLAAISLAAAIGAGVLAVRR